MRVCSATSDAIFGTTRPLAEYRGAQLMRLPSWAKYRHGAHGEAVLFSFHDLPAMQALGLYREEH